ncbi:hypothetical protein DRP07_12635 [Archaeoglobales archaeon]|nr:MAG: hypothetical protein DRP07_12635 [Archaeoglobales archaeon]
MSKNYYLNGLYKTFVSFNQKYPKEVAEIIEDWLFEMEEYGCDPEKLLNLLLKEASELKKVVKGGSLEGHEVICAKEYILDPLLKNFNSWMYLRIRGEI